MQVNPSQASVRIPVDVRRFPWIRRLAADYAYNFKAVASFFSGDPADQKSWAEAIRRTQAHDRPRGDIARIIARQQERRQAPPRAREQARLLGNSSTVAIVTGQQAGLFGGPVFTLLKAITALKLAEQVARDHHVPAVAIFWIDAEDHDWEEVRSCTVFEQDLTPDTISLPARPGADPVPVATIHLDNSVGTALDRLEQLLPLTEFRPAVAGALRQAYAPGTGMAEAFGRWIEHVLGDRGLVVYDSSDPASKPLASRVFAHELSRPGQTVKLAALAGSDLTARGYHAQVNAPHDDSLALFHLDGSRRPIRQQDGGFVVGDRQYPPDRLRQRATEEPAGFSPSVLLRPVVQDTLFPTVCYVAGPNELAYLGQLRRVYEHFGVPMPLMYPRATATIFDAAALRFLNKYNVRLEALQARDEAALNALLEAQIPSSVEQSFRSASQAIAAQMGEVIHAIPAIDPTLEGAAQSTLGRMQHDLETLHTKMIQAAKRRDETLRRQFIHTRALAFPHGEPQERAIGFIWFLNQYGPALIERLDEELPLDLGRHWIVTI